MQRRFERLQGAPRRSQQPFLSACCSALCARPRPNALPSHARAAKPTRVAVACWVGSQGYWGVYRITFVLAAFHLIMMSLTAVTSAFSTYVHSGHWWAKILGLGALLIAALFAPNDLFAYYAWIARVFAPLFLIYQLIVYIDFG